eukprot:278736_1
MSQGPSNRQYDLEWYVNDETMHLYYEAKSEESHVEQVLQECKVDLEVMEIEIEYLQALCDSDQIELDVPSNDIVFVPIDEENTNSFDQELFYDFQLLIHALTTKIMKLEERLNQYETFIWYYFGFEEIM